MNFLHELVDQGRRLAVDAMSGGGIERDAPFSPDVPEDLRNWLPDLFDRFPIVLPWEKPKPVDPALVELARRHRLVVSVEDNGLVGGCGSVLLATLNQAGVDTPVRLHGIPQQFLGHAKRAVLLERIGLTAQPLARSIVEDVTALDRGETLLPVD